MINIFVTANIITKLFSPKNLKSIKMNKDGCFKIIIFLFSIQSYRKNVSMNVIIPRAYFTFYRNNCIYVRSRRIHKEGSFERIELDSKLEDSFQMHDHCR